MLIWGRSKSHSGAFSGPAELVLQQQAICVILVRNSLKKENSLFSKMFGVRKQHQQPFSYGKSTEL